MNTRIGCGLLQDIVNHKYQGFDYKVFQLGKVRSQSTFLMFYAMLRDMHNLASSFIQAANLIEEVCFMRILFKWGYMLDQRNHPPT